MSNEEMIKWACGDLNALIWLARMQERQKVFDELSGVCKMESDAAALASYPGGLEDMPTDEDYMAALGPCGK